MVGGNGQDTFLFRNSFGVDVVEDFVDNTDSIRLLHNSGITTFAQARTYASQAGSDVVFNFGNGDVLTVRNSTIAALADDMVFV